MNALDWIAIAIVLLFWFFIIAPMIFSSSRDSYRDSLITSFSIHAILIIFVILLSLGVWAFNRVIGLLP